MLCITRVLAIVHLPCFIAMCRQSEISSKSVSTFPALVKRRSLSSRENYRADGDRRRLTIAAGAAGQHCPADSIAAMTVLIKHHTDSWQSSDSSHALTAELGCGDWTNTHDDLSTDENGTKCGRCRRVRTVNVVVGTWCALETLSALLAVTEVSIATGSNGSKNAACAAYMSEKKSVNAL